MSDRAACKTPLNSAGHCPVLDDPRIEEIRPVLERRLSVDFVIAAIRQCVGDDLGPVSGQRLDHDHRHALWECRYHDVGEEVVDVC